MFTLYTLLNHFDLLNFRFLQNQYLFLFNQSDEIELFKPHNN